MAGIEHAGTNENGYVIERKKDQKNGTEKATLPPVKTDVKLPQQPPAPNQPETGKPSLEERIRKVEELRSLTAKRQRTIDTLHQLRAFHFASDDTCMLTIADTQANKFQTGNSTLLRMIKGYLESVLGDKVSALDDDILAFKI